MATVGYTGEQPRYPFRSKVSFGYRSVSVVRESKRIFLRANGESEGVNANIRTMV